MASILHFTCQTSWLENIQKLNSANKKKENKISNEKPEVDYNEPQNLHN